MVSDTKSYMYGNIMCRSSRHLELATSRLSTAFRERDDTREQVMEAERAADGDETSKGNKKKYGFI